MAGLKDGIKTPQRRREEVEAKAAKLFELQHCSRVQSLQHEPDQLCIGC